MARNGLHVREEVSIGPRDWCPNLKAYCLEHSIGHHQSQLASLTLIIWIVFTTAWSVLRLREKKLLSTGTSTVIICLRNQLWNQKLKEIFKSFGLTQLINEPKRTTSTTATLIDLFATTNPRNISRAIVAESCRSDHDMLISVRKINNLKEQPRVIKCRNYAKYDRIIFCSDLKKVPWDTVLSLTNVDEAWSLWKYNFTAVCDKHAPLIDRKVRGRNCPWLTLEIKQMMRARDASLKKFRRSKLDQN